MPRVSAVRPARSPARLARTALVLALLLPALPGCAPTVRDQVARQDVESLQTNVQQIESTLQARQAGVYEQIRDLREGQSRLERVIEENARQAKNTGQQVDRLREHTREELDKRDQAQREAAQADAEQLTTRFGARFDTIQKGLQTVNDNLVALSAFEKKQEERIAKMQEQSQAQLKVVVDEVGKENQRLTREIAAVRADLESARQEAGQTRQGLAGLQEAMQQIAERLAAAQGEIRELADQLTAAQKQAQELAQRQESTRKAASERPGQHTVRAGETLTTIAARYGVRVKDLMEQNRITDANSIREGQKLSLPQP